MIEPDFHVTVRVKNNHIVRRMRAAGILSMRELARLSLVSFTRVYAIANFKLLPITRQGEWSDTALGISAALHCEPEDLWPEQLTRIRARCGHIEFEANQQELQAIPTTKLEFESKDLALLLNRLSPREQQVIKRRYGLGCSESTLQEVGDEIQVTKARVREIEYKALRKMAALAKNKHLTFGGAKL